MATQLAKLPHFKFASPVAFSLDIPLSPPMADITYHNDLLAPYLALDQGEKVQAECTSPSLSLTSF